MSAKPQRDDTELSPPFSHIYQTGIQRRGLKTLNDPLSPSSHRAKRTWYERGPLTPLKCNLLLIFFFSFRLFLKFDLLPRPLETCWHWWHLQPPLWKHGWILGNLRRWVIFPTAWHVRRREPNSRVSHALAVESNHRKSHFYKQLRTGVTN